jgi:peptide/nickel transport system substrate-binding protein
VAVFPDILAESFNMVVPKAVVTKESPSAFSNHPVGTGPFMFQSWQKGISAVFVRNPHYFHTGKPYVDKVITDMNVSANVIALRVEKGELDGFGIGSDIAPADVQQARTDPKYKQYLANLPATINDYLILNTNKGPLTNLALRQAVAMAINRTLLVRLLGGVAIPATQLYIPIEPQYDATLDQHPIYPYDLQKATALVKASGYHGQPITLYYANDAPTYVSIATGVRQGLEQIGINVAMHGYSSSVATSALPSSADIIENGISPDYPDGYDGYSYMMACGTTMRYCDATADKLVAQAETLPFGAARNALLRQAQARIIKAGALVPTVFFTSPTLIAPRVRGFYYHPVFGWQFENYWIKS